MRAKHSAPVTLDSSAAAIRYLAANGYDSTTAGDLADAIGMSRSTFFRRFGSKDDVIFADHDEALSHLEQSLASAEVTPNEALVDGTAEVLQLLVRDPEATRLRFDLMRDNAGLRERELVITHRYERVFTQYIRRVQQPGTPGWVAPALAAALVAVHNATLKAWLREQVRDAPATLITHLRELVRTFSRWLIPGEEQPRVLVAVYDAGASHEAVLEAVAGRLGEA